MRRAEALWFKYLLTLSWFASSPSSPHLHISSFLHLNCTPNCQLACAVAEEIDLHVVGARHGPAFAMGRAVTPCLHCLQRGSVEAFVTRRTGDRRPADAATGVDGDLELHLSGYAFDH